MRVVVLSAQFTGLHTPVFTVELRQVDSQCPWARMVYHEAHLTLVMCFCVCTCLMAGLDLIQVREAPAGLNICKLYY